MKKLNHFPRKLLAVQTLAVVAMAWNPLTTAASFAADANSTSNTVTKNGVTTTFADEGWPGNISVVNGQFDIALNVADAKVGNATNPSEVAIAVGATVYDTNPADTDAALTFSSNAANQKVVGPTTVAGKGATFSLSSTGEDFNVTGVYLKSNPNAVVISGVSDQPEYAPVAFETRHGARSTLTFSGKNTVITGNIMTEDGATTTLTSDAEGFTLNGSLRTYLSRTSGSADLQNAELPGAKLTAVFSGDNATVNGRIDASSNQGTTDVTFSGKNATLNGLIYSTTAGSLFSKNVPAGTDYSYGNEFVHLDGNKTTVTFSGENATHKGSIASYGKNPLVVNYTGGNAVITGTASSSFSYLFNRGGITEVNLAKNATLNGNINNTSLAEIVGVYYQTKSGERVYTDGYKRWDNKGQLTFNVDNSTWVGNLSSDTGKSILTFTGESEWRGNLTSQMVALKDLTEEEKLIPDLTQVYLKDTSHWTGRATGSGEVYLSGNARWDVSSSSTIDLLEMADKSIVSLAGSARTLTTKDLKGEGLVLMDLIYSDDSVASYRDSRRSDYLIVKPDAGKSATSGATYTIVASTTSDLTNLKEDNKLFFATAPANSTTFAVGTTRIEIPNYESLFNDLKTYTVAKETDETDTDYKGLENWYLTIPKEVPPQTTPEEPVTPPVTDPTAPTQAVNPNGLVPTPALSAALSIWRDNDTLVKRLGDLHLVNRGEYASGSWVRLAHQKTERSAGDNAFKAPFDRVQLGYDFQLNPTWFLGASYGYGWGDFDYDAGKGKLHSNELTVYATNVRENGHTWDFVARVGRLSSEYTTNYGDKAKFKNWAASLGVEYGKRFDVTERFALEPQAQLTYHRLWGDEYTSRYGITVNQDNVDSLVGRVGVLASYSWSGTDRAGRVYAKASVLHDFKADTSNTIAQGAQITRSDDLGDTWYVVGVGTNVKLGSAWQLYADLETGLAATAKTKYNINAGVRYTF
ncbi:MAG: autotransporter outer membrane beta-barrel domain-containing protein [Sutterella wadsworthensis]|nr:autotransporter outer membrane beta-barrel domain-containing protein [Sutterella wadsworthensis]